MKAKKKKDSANSRVGQIKGPRKYSTALRKSIHDPGLNGDDRTTNAPREDDSSVKEPGNETVITNGDAVVAEDVRETKRKNYDTDREEW